MRRSIYVKEEDLELFEWAEEIGESLSGTIAYALLKLQESGATEVPQERKETNKDILLRIADKLEDIGTDIRTIRRIQTGLPID